MQQCLVTSNEFFSLTSQKGDSVAGVDYLKVKNDVIHCKTMIVSGRSQIHAAPNFSLLSSRIASYVTITCYTSLHQATRGERIALGGVGTFSFLIVILNNFSVLCNLRCAMLLQVIQYSG